MFDYYEVAIGFGMLFLLCMGAYCDYSCREIPDSISLPFLFLGLFESYLSGRYVCFTIVAAIFLLFNHGYQPKLFQKLNKKILIRAYGSDDDSMEREEAEINERSDFFFGRYEAQIRIISGVIFCSTVLAVIGMLWVSAISTRTSLSRPIAVTIALSLIVFLHLKSEEKSDNDVEHEKLSAMGGADVIYLLAILAYWGIFRAIYCITGMFVAILIIIGCRKIVAYTKNVNSEKSVPLIYYLAWVSPVGILAANSLGAATAEIYANFSPLFTLI